MKKSIFRSTFCLSARFAFLVFCFFLSFSSYSQFWVLSGNKADSLSKNLIEKYSIDLAKIDSYKHNINKESESYKKQDSLKFELKKDTIDFDFKSVKLEKLKNKNIFAYLFESEEAEEIDLVLDNVVLSDGSDLYFLSKDFNEFAGPITQANFKEGVKRLLHSSTFSSSGIFIILIEKNDSDKIKSNIHISALKYKEVDKGKAKLKVSSTSPSSDCYSELNPQAFAVGKFYTDDRLNCSFSVINNEDNDRRPLLLSARHCITGIYGIDPTPLTQNDIAAIENANFQIAIRYNCGSTTNETLRWTGTGSTYLASQWPSDHLLVELDDILPFSINYLGWNRLDASTNTPIYSLSHPGGVYQGRQHYSSGNITGQGADKYNVYWNIGETPTGASGGPLFKTGEHKILGGLSYGTNPDKFFKLSNAWSTGSGPLKPFLSNSQNLTSLETLMPTQINGPDILCTNSTSIYTMPNLLAGETVTWSVIGGLQILSNTGQSVTVKANGSNTSGTLIATYTVTRDAENNTTHSVSNSINIWQGGPVISVTNQTTNHTSSGYSINLNTTGTNSFHFNNTSYVNSISWSFPSGWSYSGTSGSDVNVYSWSGSNSFSVTATNSCGSNSTFFYPSGGSYRVAKSSTIYPNTARGSVNLALIEGINWDEVRKVQIVSASKGRVHYSSSIVSSYLIKENNKFNIALEKIPAGKYIVEVIYSDHRDSHHLIIE